jgi:hypothetical protein
MKAAEPSLTFTIQGALTPGACAARSAAFVRGLPQGERLRSILENEPAVVAALDGLPALSGLTGELFDRVKQKDSKSLYFRERNLPLMDAPPSNATEGSAKGHFTGFFIDGSLLDYGRAR